MTAPKPLYKPLNNKKKKTLTLEYFLGEVKKGFYGGEFGEYSLTFEQIEKEAIGAYRHWEAYPDRMPTGNLLAGLHRWLSNSKTVQKLSKQCNDITPAYDNPEFISWRAKIKTYIKNGFWREDIFGSSPPDDPNNKIPKQVLNEFKDQLQQLQEQK